MQRLQNAQKIVGTKQVSRAIAAGEVKIVYLATDADVFVLIRLSWDFPSKPKKQA